MRYKMRLFNEDYKLEESSLSRILSKMDKYDCGIITAFRTKFTYKENLERNKNLLASIYYYGFDATSVYGSYIENYKPKNKLNTVRNKNKINPNKKGPWNKSKDKEEKEHSEESFFVVDKYNTGRLKYFLKSAGTIFMQDSIIFIPKKTRTAELIGTSPFEDVWPGRDEVIKFSKLELGKESEFMTKVKNRPFVFSEELHPCKFSKPTERMGKMAMQHFVPRELKEKFYEQH